MLNYQFCKRRSKSRSPAGEDGEIAEEEDFEDLEDVPHLGEEDEAVPHPPTMPMQAHKNTEDVDGDDFEDDLEDQISLINNNEILRLYKFNRKRKTPKKNT